MLLCVSFESASSIQQKCPVRLWWHHLQHNTIGLSSKDAYFLGKRLMMSYKRAIMIRDCRFLVIDSRYRNKSTYTRLVYIANNFPVKTWVLILFLQVMLPPYACMSNCVIHTIWKFQQNTTPTVYASCIHAQG